MTTSIDDLRSANPYRNQNYSKSGWQRFLSWLGFRTEADAWKENMSVQAAEYDAALLQKQYDTEYDSALSQVSRLRQAGLNPDMNAGSVDAGSAGSMGDDPSVPMQSSGDESKIFSAVRSIFDAVNIGFGIAKNFGDLRQLGIMNDSGEITNSEKTFKFAEWVFNNTRDAFEATSSDDENFRSRFTKDNLLSQQLRLPKRFRRQFRQNLASLYDSLNQQVDFWEKNKKMNDSKLGVARQVSSQYFGDGSFESMKIVNNGLVSLSDALAESALRSEGAKAGYEGDFYSGLSGSEAAAAQNAKASNERLFQGELDPIASAAAENAEAGLRKQTASVSKTINSALEKIVHGLRDRANHGDSFAQSLLFGFAIARMSNISLSPSGLSLGINP